MTSKNLIFVANILLDCEEMIQAGQSIEGHVKAKCREFKIESLEEDITQIINKCQSNIIASVTYNYGDKNYA